MILHKNTEYLFIEVYQQSKYRNPHFDNEYLLPSLTESEYAGFIIVNFLDSAHYVSTKFYQSLGYSYKESIPSTERIENLIHPDDLVRLEIVINKAGFFRNNFSYDLRFRTKCNSYKIFKTEIKRVVNELSFFNRLFMLLSLFYTTKMFQFLILK